MKKKLAFVLGGGGSRGSLQAGALRALIEAGYSPDLVTGTSIGAANGAFMSVHGFNVEGVQRLEQIWRATVDKDLLPTDLWRQFMRTFFQRSNTKGFSQDRIREFAISNGLTPDLRFKDLQAVEFHPVATDLNAGSPVIFGLNPEELVLDCVLASMTLPPWLAPFEMEERYLMDGGAVSNLPIEAALQTGATEVIALDLQDPNEVDSAKRGLGDFFLKLDKTVESRQTQLEIELSEARGVPVRRIVLTGEKPVPLWDFTQSVGLIERGYQLTQQAMAAWPPPAQPSLWHKLNIKTIIEDLRSTYEKNT